MKIKFYRLCIFLNRLLYWSKLAIYRKNDFNVLFLLSSLVTDPSFMSISSLVLEFWEFSFMRDWPEIWKSEIPLSEFCPISGDWDKLGIPNLTQMSLMKCYWMLQNARVTAFNISELIRENQQGRKKLHPTQIRVNQAHPKKISIKF